MAAETFSPGQILQDELEARGWSQTDLAEVMGRPSRVVSEIISAKRAVTPETAQGLGAALGTGAEFWINLEGQWQLSKLQGQSEAVAQRAQLYDRFPVREMIRRGWIQASDDIAILQRNICSFFGIATPSDGLGLPHAAKRTEETTANKFQTAWLYRARSLSESVGAAVFAPKALPSLKTQLRVLAVEREEVRHVPRLLADAGIRLIIVEPLPGSKIDGVCFWIDQRPVIALSLRLDKLDNFWHTLFHEIDHVEHGEGKDAAIIDDDIMIAATNPDLPAMERRANDNAADTLIPTGEFEEFVARVNPLFSEDRIVGFAGRMKVHPSIVLGRLQHRGLVHWGALSKMREKIRDVLIPNATTDGFGH